MENETRAHKLEGEERGDKAARLTEAESRLFYARMKEAPNERKRNPKEDNKVDIFKERNMVQVLSATDDLEKFEAWILQMEHWMKENFKSRKSEPS